MANWDWYQCSVETPQGQRVELHAEATARALTEYFPEAEIHGGRPRNGYLYGIDLTEGGKTVCAIWYGGNPGIHIIATGERAPRLRQYLDAYRIPHRVSRADAAEDWVCAGLFDRFADLMLSAAEEKGISIDQQGDWRRGKARTMYFGAKKSAVRLVVYEKGYESGGDPNWVRMEVRVRPQKQRKEIIQRLQPGELFGSARWLREMLELIGWDHLVPCPVGTVWRPTDSERMRRSLVRQYGRIIEEWANEIGSAEAMLEAMKAIRSQETGTVVAPQEEIA